MKEKPPKRVTQKLESRAPRTSLGEYQQLSGPWRKEGCWEGWEGAAREVVGKQREHRNTEIKWGRVSGRNDEQYEVSTKFKQVRTKVSTEFKLWKSTESSRKSDGWIRWGISQIAVSWEGHRRWQRTRKSVANTWKWSAVKGKSKTGQLLDWDVWLTGVYGWFNLIGS